MILTWNEEKGPLIYVNRSVVGISVKRTASVNSTSSLLTLQIGSGFARNRTKRGMPFGLRSFDECKSLQPHKKE